MSSFPLTLLRQIRTAISGMGEALAAFLAPAPRPIPIPVRVRQHRRRDPR
jgi:hypothetical protein